jgi:Family of unknown function (DUF5719)
LTGINVRRLQQNERCSDNRIDDGYPKGVLMKRYGFATVLSAALALLLSIALIPGLCVAGTGAGRTIAADSPAAPSSPVKLVFIHHSSGQNWLADGDGNLGIALRDNNYFVSDTNYGWDPGGTGIGDRTDIGNWWEWFRGPQSGTILPALYAESGQNCSYSRMGGDPGGENAIVMFKSCFPNSALEGSQSDPVPPIDTNPLKGQSAGGSDHSVANAKGIYIDLLNYFATRQDKLFIAVTAPPLTNGTYAGNARAFNNWLVNDWLASYPYNNVFVVDFYNVLTSNGGNANVSDIGSTGGNHHRWKDGAIQHKTDGGGNTAAYPGGNGGGDHPTAAGNQKATSELVPLINVAYNRFKSGYTPPGPSPPIPPEGDIRSDFYFAEGYTGSGFQEYACIANTSGADADVWVQMMFGDGTTKSQYYAVKASSRSTVDINMLAGYGKEVSMRIVSTSSGVVAERPMYFNYQGKWSGGSDVVGARAPGRQWYFAEGTTLPGFDEYVTVQNPGSTAANLTFRYMVEGKGESVFHERVGATSRATFKPINHVGVGFNISLSVESDADVVVERPMYFNYSGLASHAWNGGHDVVGATAPLREASLAEGTTRSGFEEWLCLQNPGGSAIDVDATYLLGAGQGNNFTVTYSVPAKQRLTVSVNKEVGPGKDVSISLKSASDFIAERPMYFMYHGAWDGGHDVLAGLPAGDFQFAEGYIGKGFEEWLCVENPASSSVNVIVYYYLTTGETKSVGHTIPANSRYTINVNDDLGGNLAHSTRVASNGPVLVERPMYFNFNGQWSGGHDVVGFEPLAL